MIRKSSHISWVMVLLVALLLSACKRTERASRKPLEGKKTTYLINQLNNNQLNFESLSSKANITFIAEDKKTSFKATLRMKKDSVIWISITPLLGIEMARVMITTDTVKVINRIEGTYFIGDYEYLNKKFNVDLDYEIIQSLLIGNMIPFEEDDKLRFAIDKDRYYLGNLHKRKVRKAERKPEVIEKKKDEVMSLWLNAENYKIEKLLVSDLTADRFVSGEFSDHRLVSDELFPHHLDFHVDSDKKLDVAIAYSKVTLNKSLTFSFNISSKYERIYY